MERRAMIKLTDPNENVRYIDPSKIVMIADEMTFDFFGEGNNPEKTGRTELSLLDYGTVTVTESPETVARLITEYKQRQMRLQAAYAAFYNKQHKDDMPEAIHYIESEDRGE
jgi:hypothetical protein